MKKKSKIVIIAIIALSIAVVAFLWYLTLGHGSLDYQATYDEFESSVKSGDNKLVYVMPSVSGFPDNEVSFSDCAFSLEINGTSLPPVNLHFINPPGLFGSPAWQSYAQISKGSGIFNSVTFLQGNISYIVTFFDVDSNAHITWGDYVTVECTEPLTPGTSYLLNVFVDIDGTWGIGRVYGTYQN